MDINQILPFLLKGDDTDQKSKLLAAMLSGAGGSKEDILASMAGGMAGNGGSSGVNAADILSQMKGGGGNADMMALMNMLKMKQQKKTPDKNEGLQIISDFAPPDILGTLYKMLEPVKP